MRRGWLTNNKIKGSFQPQLIRSCERKAILEKKAPPPKSKAFSILSTIGPLLVTVGNAVYFYLNIEVATKPIYTFDAFYTNGSRLLTFEVPAKYIALRPEFAHLGFLMKTASPGFWQEIVGVNGRVKRLHMFRKFYFSETVHRVKGSVNAGAALYKNRLWFDYCKVKIYDAESEESEELMQLRGLFVLDVEIDGQLQQIKVVLGRWLRKLPVRDRTTQQSLAWETPSGEPTEQF